MFSVTDLYDSFLRKTQRVRSYTRPPLPKEVRMLLLEEAEDFTREYFLRHPYSRKDFNELKSAFYFVLYDEYLKL